MVSSPLLLCVSSFKGSHFSEHCWVLCSEFWVNSLFLSSPHLLSNLLANFDLKSAFLSHPPMVCCAMFMWTVVLCSTGSCADASSRAGLGRRGIFRFSKAWTCYNYCQAGTGCWAGLAGPDQTGPFTISNAIITFQHEYNDTDQTIPKMYWGNPIPGSMPLIGPPVIAFLADAWQMVCEILSPI